MNKHNKIKDIDIIGVQIDFGGDHSVAAGSVSAVAKHYEPEGEIGVIWIDAHGFRKAAFHGPC